MMKRVLLGILAAVMLAGFAFAFSAPELTEEAKAAHLDEMTVPEDDEYAFLYN